MNYELSQEQLEYKRIFREFCTDKIACRTDQVEQELSYLLENYRLLGKHNFFGIALSKKYGGEEKSFLTLVLIWEELARVCSSTFLSGAIGSSVAGISLDLFGSEIWKEKFLGKLSQGEKIGAVALSEPQGGSDLTSLQTSAQKLGPDYILNGHKSFVTNGPIADFVILIALTDATANLDKRMTLFLIEKNNPGILPGAVLEKLGACGAPVSELILQNCLVSKDHLLGNEGEGFFYAAKIKDLLRLAFAVYSLGIAQACVEESISYAQRRQAGGKSIARFQEVSFKIADMQMLVDTGRLLLYRAAWLMDQKIEASNDIALAKLFLSEAATWCAGMALQIHGGYGFLKRYKVERLYRDAKLGEIGGDPSEIQRQIIARSLLREGF